MSAPRVRFLDVPLDPIDMAATVEAVVRQIEAGVPGAHLGVNAANLVMARDDAAYRADLEAADLVTADGQSVVWGARLRGTRVPERVTGIDLMDALLELSRRRAWPVYLLGATAGVVEALAGRLSSRGIPVAGFRDGYLEAEAWPDAAAAVRDSGARILFVGMPSPRKERFIIGAARPAGVPYSVGVGGSFDVMAGRVRRAPRPLQRLGLEWLYRLVQEPRRLFRRYAVTNTRFVALLVRDAFGRRPGPRARPATFRAVALGYQGFGNVGDEAILAGIEAALRGGPVHVAAVIGGDRGGIAAFPAARRVTSRRLLPTWAALAELRRADLLIVSGGGLIHDHWPIVIPRYLLWSVLARVLGARICWVGVGVGPIRRPLARRLAALAARLARVVTVRDEASLALVRRLAPGREAQVVPDPALFLSPPPHAGGRGLALIVRPPLPSEAGLAPALTEALAVLAGRRIAAGVPVSILTMEHAFDEAFVTELDAAIRREAGRAAPIERLPLDPAAAMARLAGHDEAVSMRLHGLILCAMAGTPCVPLVYDAKVASGADRLGLSAVAMSLRDASPDRLLACLDAVSSPTTRQSVGDAVAAMAAERDAVAALVRSSLDG